MRFLPVALVAVHLALLGLAYDKLVAGKPGPAPSIASPSRVAPPPARLESRSLKDLEALAEIEDSLVRAIQNDSTDEGAMVELAHLYMREGSFEHAVGPLARAMEVDPDRDDLWYELLLAMNLAGIDREQVDLAAMAREFAEMTAMAGHGC
jgi:cytochrome c-type biogenesis protein CcmH/NrfG